MNNFASKPSTVERLLATSWLFVRRLACFIFAACLVGGAAFNVVRLFQGVVSMLAILWVVVGLLLAGFILWVGIYGIAGGCMAPSSKYRFEDTKALYRLRKKKYGWRW